MIEIPRTNSTLFEYTCPAKKNCIIRSYISSTYSQSPNIFFESAGLLISPCQTEDRSRIKKQSTGQIVPRIDAQSSIKIGRIILVYFIFKKNLLSLKIVSNVKWIFTDLIIKSRLKNAWNGRDIIHARVQRGGGFFDAEDPSKGVYGAKTTAKKHRPDESIRSCARRLISRVV